MNGEAAYVAVTNATLMKILYRAKQLPREPACHRLLKASRAANLLVEVPPVALQQKVHGVRSVEELVPASPAGLATAREFGTAGLSFSSATKSYSLMM